MKRRRFIVVGGALAAVATGAIGLKRFFWKGSSSAPTGPAPEPPSKEQHGLQDDLRQYYHYLQIDDGVLWAYLADLRKHRRTPSKADARQQFLMSTDFFANGGDEQTPLSYRMLHDPYVSVCYNPMA
jgi:hypothetical protein